MSKIPEEVRANGPNGRPTKGRGRAIGFACLLVVIFLALFAWNRPLWLLDHVTSIRLRLHGVRSEYVTVNGYKIHYLVGGRGKPLVLVHGLGSRASDWAGLIPYCIRGGYRVYALDLLGYGLSSQPRDAGYSISQEASIVEGFMNSQHLAQVDLAGWSMGGWIAMRVALDRPERIRRLVLLDSAGLWFKTTFDVSLFEPNSPAQFDQLEDLLTPKRRFMPRFLTMAILRRGKKYGWVVRRSVDSMMMGEDLMDGNLAPLTMPVLIGWGKEDRLIPLTIAYELHAQIPQSVLALYDGCGHLAPGLSANQVGPNVVNFLNAEPPPRRQIEEITKR